MANKDMFDDTFEENRKMSMHKPYDSLDLAYLEVEPAYGKEATQEFSERLRKITNKAEPLYHPDGKPKLDEHGRQMYAVDTVLLWEELGFYVRDLRFGNLSSMNGDVEFCEHYMDLAGDLLNFGCASSFTTAYRRVVTKLELSQSKDGFYRRNKNTFTGKKITVTDPRQKKMMGGDLEE
jgi:hypothetical protein